MKKIKSLFLLSTISSLVYAQNVDINQTHNISLNNEINTTISDLNTTNNINNTFIYNPKKDIELGKKYLKENNINLAIAAFDRVLIYQPNNDEAKFYLGKTFAKQQDIKLAKQYFTSIQNPTPKMKKEIKEFYAKYPDRHLKFDLFFKAGAIYDTNIDNDTDYTNWEVYIDGTSKQVTQVTDKVSALNIYELLSFSPVYYMQTSNIRNTFNIYNKNVIDHQEKDIQVLNYTPSVSQKLNIFDTNFNLEHSLTYSYIRYGNESYMHKFGANEEIRFNFLEDHTNITDIAFYYNKYIQDDELNYYQFNLDTKVIKDLSALKIALGIGYETTKKENTTDKALEYNDYKANFNSEVSIFSYSIAFDFKYDLKRYNEIDKYFLKTQTDKKLDYTLSLNSNGYFRYQTQIEYIKNISNLEPYSYDKWLISFNISKSFKGL